jgi:hypothetical protein
LNQNRKPRETTLILCSCRIFKQQERDMTNLDKPIRRGLQVGDKTYTLVIDPKGLKLTEKGRRKGIDLAWADIVNGDAGLAAALQASVGA